MESQLITSSNDSISYIKELRLITGSVTGALLMQQLDYHFMSQPHGFYKFMKASNHRDYQVGKSWTEELGFSIKEFRGAWQKIGTTYNSKNEYDLAKENQFRGKLYCSYIDRKSQNKTFYFKNHILWLERVSQLCKSYSSTLALNHYFSL